MNWDGIFQAALGQGLGYQAAYFAIAAIGLNLHFGYTGLLNFGHVGFMALGAYGVGISIAFLGWSLWVGILVGLAAALVFALLLGLPTLRLRADYLAIVTIAAGEIVRISFRATALRDVTGGSNGITGFSGPFYALNPFSGGLDLGIVEFTRPELWAMIVGWGLALLLVLFTALLIHSPWGRVLKAIREDEDAARALGKNAYSMKMQSLVLGGLMGALGGMMFVLGQGSVQPTPFDLGPPKTFLIYVAVILGGAGTLWGPVIGSVIFVGLLAFTDTILRQAEAADYIPGWLMSGVQVGQMRFILLGLGLVLLMVYRPQGMFGDIREMAFDVR